MIKANIKKVIFTIATFVFLVLVAKTWLVADKASGENPPGMKEKYRLQPGNASLVARGKIIYGEQCSSCHGVKLEGQPNWRSPGENGRLQAPPHNQTGHTHHHPDKLLFNITRLGSAAIIGKGYESDMKGFADILSDEQIVAVLSFIKSTWPSPIRKRHDLVNENALKQQTTRQKTQQ